MIIAAVGLTTALGFGGYMFYQRWQGKRLVKRADTYLAWGDLKSAALTAHRAYQMSHSNVEACRVLARIAEQTGQAAAIEWRKNAVIAAPQSSEDKIALAKTAVQFDRLPLAETTLNQVSAAGDQSAAYHDALGQVLAAKKDSLGAEKHHSEAVHLDPSNKTYRFHLAAIQLRSSAADTRMTAENTLRAFFEDKELRIAAARAMRDDAAQRKDGPMFFEAAAALGEFPEATFRDRLLYAQALHTMDYPEFAGRLTDLQKEAEQDSGKLSQLLAWMSTNGLAVLAIHWTRELSPEALARQPVPIAVADCYLAANDWAGLKEWCKRAEWNQMEFLRHGYLARIARQEDDKLAAETEWNLALHMVGTNGAHLEILEQGVVKWGWRNEAEDLLWKLAGDPERKSTALATLYQFYLDKGDTPNLYRAVSRLAELKPDDDAVQNNRTQLSLLLNLDAERAHQAAERLYRKAPNNAVYVSTYAFSLFRRGRFQQAVKVMNELKPEELNQPVFAGYYGVFLVAAGEKSKAAPFLQEGATAPMLPEERALLQSAESKINQ